jgi:hypothetical protein
MDPTANDNDNDSPTLDEMWELDQRFGPIPEPYVNLEQQQRRRRRLGVLAGLEDQATRCLDVARHLEEEIHELKSDDPIKMADKIAHAMNHRERVIREAEEALSRAGEVRRLLHLPESPLRAAVETAKRVAAR